MQPQVAIHAAGNSFAFAKFMQSNFMNWLRHELIAGNHEFSLRSMN